MIPGNSLEKESYLGEFRVNHLSIYKVSVSPIKKKNELYRRSPTSTKHIKKTQQRSGDCVGVAKTLVHIVGTYSMHIYAVGNPLNLRKWTLLKCEVIPPIFVNIQRVLDCPSTTFARNIYHTVSLFLKQNPNLWQNCWIFHCLPCV